MRVKRFINIVLIALVFPMFVQAEVGDQYLLPKFGVMYLDANEGESVQLLLSVGVLYGYGVAPEIALEFELNAAISGGEYKRRDVFGNNETGKYSIYTLAAYGVYRYPFLDTAYIKGKIGLLIDRTETTNDQTEVADVNTCLEKFLDCYGLAGGIGVGFLLRRFLTLEAEVTQIKRDLIFLNFGVHYPF